MPLLNSDHVIVVGAGLAGWRTCEELRRHGYPGGLTLVGEETELPYDRPPLSKQVLAGKWPLTHTVLATHEKLAVVDVDLRLGVSAQHLDVERTSVTLSDGSVIEGTHVVVATGTRARRLPWYDSRHYELRHHADASRLLARLDSLDDADVVAVVGGGFIGAEVATSLNSRGLHPIVLEAAVRPLLSVLGESVSRWLGDLAADAGVELRTNQRLVGTEFPDANGDVEVLFEDGSTLRARAIVMGVGAEANVEWLSTSGLTISNGIVVDEHLLAAANVAAVGDVASFPWRDGSMVRIEHWQVAADHAASLALYWTRDIESPPLVPYFWSDQYGRKIQMLGHPHPEDDVVRVKDTGEGQWLALYSRENVVTGAVALNQPRGLMLSKGLLDEATTMDEALERAPWSVPSQST